MRSPPEGLQAAYAVSRIPNYFRVWRQLPGQKCRWLGSFFCLLDESDK
jgi:hypothetical protein